MTAVLGAALVTAASEAGDFVSPALDYHAFAPEFVILGTLVLVLLVDLFTDEENAWALPSLAGIGMLAALVPVITLALDGQDRVMFGGAYVVDDFSLVMNGENVDDPEVYEPIWKSLVALIDDYPIVVEPNVDLFAPR